jgi:hypothetical protein
MLSEVIKRKKAAKEVRRRNERDWWLNMAFINNEQWTIYNRNLNIVQTRMMDMQKPRLVSNIITPRIRLEYSLLTREVPRFKVEGVTVAKAKEVYAYLKDGWDRRNWEQEYRDALLWAICCATGFVKTYWDPNGGPAYPGGERGGEVMMDSASPFELYWDPYARSIDEAAWVIHERIRPKEYAKEKYGAEVSASPLDLLSTYIGALRVNYNKTLVTSCLISEYWERPSARNPRGYYLVFAGEGQVLYESDNPYVFDDDPQTCAIPFSGVRETPVPGELYGATWVTECRQINVIYNRLRNDILENSVKLSNPPLIAPAGAFRGDITMNSGEILQYNPLALQGGQIKPLEIVPYPPQAVNMLVRLEQEADERVGINPMMRGMMPRGMRSKQQMQAVQEMDDQRRQTIMVEQQTMIERSLNMALVLSRHFMKLPRPVYGGDVVYTVKGDDLPAESKVRVKAVYKEPPNQLQDQQYLFALYDRRVIQDPRLLTQLSRFGSFDEAFVDADLDTTQAQRENRRMTQGQPVQAEDWQNHPIHLVEHNRFRKAEEYETLPDEVKQLFAQHCAEHQKFEEAAKQAQGPGPPGQLQQPGFQGAPQQQAPSVLKPKGPGRPKKGGMKVAAPF